LDDLVSRISVVFGIVIIISIGGLLLSTTNDATSDAIGALGTEEGIKILRPDADLLFTGGDPANWVGKFPLTTPGIDPLYPFINEETPDQGTYLDYTTNSEVTVFTIGLSDVEDPKTSLGHVIRYDARSQNSVSLAVVQIELYQGAVQVADLGNLTLSSDWVTYQYVLSDTQADSITDYTDLKFVLTPVSNMPHINISWMELQVSPTSWADLQRDVDTTSQSAFALLFVVVTVIAVAVVILVIRRF
jgi:hypothetical protein